MSSGSISHASVSTSHGKSCGGPAVLIVGADQQADPCESSQQFPHSPYSDGPRHVSTLIVHPHWAPGNRDPRGWPPPTPRPRESPVLPIPPTPPISRSRENIESDTSPPAVFLPRGGHTIPLSRLEPSHRGDFDHGSPTPEGRRRAVAAYEVLRKWPWKFSGRPDEDAEAFLDRLTELRHFSYLDDADLLRCLPICLSGVAALWYETCANITDWNGFVAAWRENFGNPDYQEFLERDIRVRKQGPAEPVRDYLACMKAMMKRLRPPWPEEKRVKRIYWGAREDIRCAISLRHLPTLAELESDLREAERNTVAERSDIYRSTDLVNKEFAYDPRRYGERPKTFGRDKDFRNARYETVNAVQTADDRDDDDVRYRAGLSRPRDPLIIATSPVLSRRPAPHPERLSHDDPDQQRAKPMRASTSANSCVAQCDTAPRRAALLSARQPLADDTCWNGQKPGNGSRGCREEPRIHCYRCGAPDVTTKQCRQCIRVPGDGTQNRA